MEYIVNSSGESDKFTHIAMYPKGGPTAYLQYSEARNVPTKGSIVLKVTQYNQTTTPRRACPYFKEVGFKSLSNRLTSTCKINVPENTYKFKRQKNWHSEFVTSQTCSTHSLSGQHQYKVDAVPLSRANTRSTYAHEAIMSLLTKPAQPISRQQFRAEKT
ncbi:hypothetical protein [Pseudoalteromonas luteoviolacea]|uniref:Uncharacterized protein n=1 Tax=Pseudoalteromonas luteoviolacea S4060-1 TaxID=1365257 RepID=A0A162BCL1_9GAMM|nr:hypothetical protein [Pseudoalteromonas luteoviolacea]KZN70552.1 hypothetical protein N478_01190 [Pseudoalteromonas luteoviolacea S4060-1]